MLPSWPEVGAPPTPSAADMGSQGFHTAWITFPSVMALIPLTPSVFSHAVPSQWGLLQPSCLKCLPAPLLILLPFLQFLSFSFLNSNCCPLTYCVICLLNMPIMDSLLALGCKLSEGRDFCLFGSLLYSWPPNTVLGHSKFSKITRWMNAWLRRW